MITVAASMKEGPVSSFPSLARPPISGSAFPRHSVVGAGEWAYWHTGSDHLDSVVVLHGLGGDHAGLAEMLFGLREANVVAPDLPGYGASAALRAPHTLENYAVALEEFRVALGLDDFHLVGHSLGASIALVYAGMYGTGLKSLCLLNPVSTADSRMAPVGKLYYRVGALLPQRARQVWLASRAAVYLSSLFVIKTKDPVRRRQILEHDYTNYQRASTQAMVQSVLSYDETPFADYAAKVDARTLLLTGRGDGIASPGSVGRLCGRMRAAHLELVDGGHLVPMERPEVVATIVNDFIRGQTPNGRDSCP